MMWFGIGNQSGTYPFGPCHTLAQPAPPLVTMIGIYTSILAPCIRTRNTVNAIIGLGNFKIASPIRPKFWNTYIYIYVYIYIFRIIINQRKQHKYWLIQFFKNTHTHIYIYNIFYMHSSKDRCPSSICRSLLTTRPLTGAAKLNGSPVLNGRNTSFQWQFFQLNKQQLLRIFADKSPKNEMV